MAENLPSTTLARLSRELKMLSTDPPPGICVYPPDPANISLLRAEMSGPPSSPYALGTFSLEVLIPPSYPFEPPKVCDTFIHFRILQQQSSLY